MSDSTAPAFGADPKPYWLALGVVVLMELVRRLAFGFVPDDFTAYLSAADVFAAGGNPYADYATSARYNGKPYNYFPGTLYLIVWMAWVPTVVAVVVDFVARVTALFFAIRWLARRVCTTLPPHFVFIIALACEPLFIDVLFGNLVSYLLAAWALCAALSERDVGLKEAAAAACAGVVFAFKPFWYFAGAYCFIVRKNWRGLVALTAGGGTIALLSLPHFEWRDTFVAHTQAMRDFYFSVDLLSLAPPLLGVAAVAWAAAAFALARRGGDWVWLFGCTSVIVFPRLATYSYSIMLPVVLFFVARWGALRGLLYGAVLIGPIPWLLRVSTLLPGEQLENWTHFVWSWITAVVLFVVLWRDGDRGAT